MVVSASKLRENIYHILDEVAETGVPVEVVRKGVRLRIVAEKKGSKLARLKKHPNVLVDDKPVSLWYDCGLEKEWLEKWDRRK